MDEPDVSIENGYENGRCVRQVNRYPDREPYTFTFTYQVQAEHVQRTDVTRSDGTWTHYTWAPSRYALRETQGFGSMSAEFTYERHERTNEVTSLTVTCPDRQGRPLRHSAVVHAGNQEEVKVNILQTHCRWNHSAWRARSQKASPDVAQGLDSFIAQGPWCRSSRHRVKHSGI